MFESKSQYEKLSPDECKKANTAAQYVIMLSAAPPGFLFLPYTSLKVAPLTPQINTYPMYKE